MGQSESAGILHPYPNECSVGFAMTTVGPPPETVRMADLAGELEKCGLWIAKTRVRRRLSVGSMSCTTMLAAPLSCLCSVVSAALLYAVE